MQIQLIAFFEEMSQQTTMYPGACGQIPTFSPTRKMNSTRSIDSESPITDFTDEELFHLEMSDEGSGGKRSRLGKYLPAPYPNSSPLRYFLVK